MQLRLVDRRDRQSLLRLRSFCLGPDAAPSRSPKRACGFFHLTARKNRNLLCLILQKSRRLLPSTQLRMSSRFRSPPLPFAHRFSRPWTLMRLSIKGTLSTLTIPLRPPASQVQTVSKNCAPCTVRAGGRMTSGHSRGWRRTINQIASQFPL